MVTATFRFYEELNDFLAPARRKQAFGVACAAATATKHMIEALVSVPAPWAAGTLPALQHLRWVWQGILGRLALAQHAACAGWGAGR